jgi:hypothetical protein
MAGQTVRILPRSDYTFTGLGASASATVVVARKIDTSMWREGVVLMRLHAVNYGGGASPATIKLNMGPDGYTDEDPGLVWTFPSATLLTFTEGTDAAPSVKNAELAAAGSAFGPLIQLLLVATQNGTAGTTFTASISIDLNLKGQ